MAQAGFTPISLYYSTTAAAVPTSANLVAGELALNTVDEKLYFKNAAGTVKLLASNATSAPVLSFQTSLSGLTPSTATTGVVTLAGTLGTSSGGTNLTSFTSGGAMYATSTSALTTGTLPTTAGGTALTSFTSGGVVYASSTSALTTNATFNYDGNTFLTTGASNPIVKVKSSAGTIGNYAGILFDTNNSFSGIGQAYIRGISSASGNSNTDLAFGVNQSGFGAPYEAARIDASGNLGLGTSSPISILHANSATETILTLQSTATTTGTTRLRLYSATATTPYNWYLQGDPQAGALRFYNAQTSSEAARIDQTGNFLIGTTSVGAGFTGPQLVVGKSANPYGIIEIQGAKTGSDGAAGLLMFYNTSGSSRLAVISADRSGADNSGALIFQTWNAGTGAERGRFESLGTFVIKNDYQEQTYTANSSTAITLNIVTNGTDQVITLTGTATITMPTATAGKSFLLKLKTGAGGYTVTWSTVKWPGGTAPTLTSTASRMDIFSFFSDGTNWYGCTVGQNYTP